MAIELGLPSSSQAYTSTFVFDLPSAGKIAFSMLIETHAQTFWGQRTRIFNARRNTMRDSLGFGFVISGIELFKHVRSVLSPDGLGVFIQDQLKASYRFISVVIVKVDKRHAIKGAGGPVQ